MHTAGQEDLSDGQAIIAMDSCAQMMATRYDDRLGGFGSAPKFPRPSEMNLLLVQHLRAKAAGSNLEAGQPHACCLHVSEVQVTQQTSCPEDKIVSTGFEQMTLMHSKRLQHYV